MSGTVISMKEWERAKFMDGAVRLGVRLLESLPEKDRQSVLRKLERAVERGTGAAQVTDEKC